MLRSMFTAISSLTLHQTYLDVVANNLANVNTIGYKSSRFSFQDQISQLINPGSAPVAGGLGGTNPTQVGLGAQLGAITTIFTQGSLQGTGRSMDVAVQGDGFFIYTDGSGQYYSRDGALNIDSDGYIVNVGTGMQIMGWTADATGAVDNTGPVGPIQVPLDSTLAQATTEMFMTGNLDSTSAAGSAGAFDTTVGVYDSLGNLQNVSVTFTRTGTNDWSWTANAPASGSGTATFDTDGQYTGGTGTITLPASGGAAATVFTFDLSNVTMLAMDTTVTSASQDGLAAGSLVGINTVGDTGEVYGVYSNGLQQRLGQLGLASFANPEGMFRVGQNLYQEWMNSGTPQIGTAGTGTRGILAAGFLEGSNVNMAQEFTNMILAQRGFQASSRVITTSDEMLQELVNLSR